MFKKALTPNFFKLFPKKEERTLPKSFYEASIKQILKPDKYITRKENYRPIFLIKLDGKSSIKY